MVSRETLINLTSGKPISESSRIIDGLAYREVVVDLLWFYHFDQILLDQWGNPALTEDFESTAPADTETSIPIVDISFSGDGNVFNSSMPSKVTISSIRGSAGTKRSYILWYGPKKAGGRFARIRFRSYDSEFRLRILMPFGRVRALESSKMVQNYSDPSLDHDRPKLNAAIVGGSNSVMRYGWVKGLSQGPMHVNQNVSLGASQMTMIASRLTELNGLESDVLFLNSVVNEYRPMQYEEYDRELARDAIRQSLIWCQANDVIPIFVIWPQMHYLRDEKEGLTRINPRDHYRDICEDFGLPYIDCYDLMHELSDQWKRPVSSFFLDDAHMLHHIAQVLGASLRNASLDLVERIRSSRDSIQATHSSSASLEAIGLGNGMNPGSNTESTISTSIISRKMVTLYEGSDLQVKVEDDWEVVGFMINARNCNGSIQIAGRTVRTVRADFSKYMGPEGFPFVCVRSLQEPVDPLDGLITISCVVPQSWHQPDELAGKTLSSVDIGKRHNIEIAELIIRQKIPSGSARRIRIDQLDITRDCLLEFAVGTPTIDRLSTDASWL